MATRNRLPDRRRCISQKVKIESREGSWQTVHYSFGLYRDNTPGELFIEVSKAGAALRTWAGEAAMLMSVALQHGTPLETIASLFVGTRCDPCGVVEGHPCITHCLSIMDLVGKDLAITFLGRDDMRDIVEPNIILLPESGRDGWWKELDCQHSG